ncbi:MAG: COR domain-containing protein [Leptolyngbyaceae cyanobacterium MO_188.B28]|nr:COR domain-containing protein [Leptolyngbyaceae cyanobacterium MO_188.B28]
MTEEDLLQVIEQAARDGVKELDLSYSELSQLPPEIGQLTNLITLDLRANQLSQLPSEIGQLNNLTQLYLSDNQLSQLPSEIGQLTNLITLDLRANQLSQLPPEISQLTNLTTLDLRANQLSQLPSEIGQVTNLTQLNLRSNQLSALPPKIGQLTNLTTLDLRVNQLSQLPPEIGQLTDLTQLYLSANQLSQLPPEIGQLTNLTQLDLSANQLSQLPSEIVRLTNLTTLALSANQLRQLPPEIVQLTNLTTLALSDNQLSQLPSEISQLTNLTTLYLRDNQLYQLPPEIGRLTNLTTLDLSENQLRQLRPETFALTKLQWLDLRENPLPIPSEILGPPQSIFPPGDANKIFSFYRQLLGQESDYLYEAKLLIVGEGGAGKTTLAKKIEDPNYQLQPDEATTEGIEVIQWHFPLRDGKDFRVNIWDFGGQEIYHTTHQFFLTKRSLYALVVDTRKEDTDFYYWLNVVDLLSDHSPLLIIKNERGDRQKDLNERELQGQFNNLKETLSTNLATRRGWPQVLANIKDYISTLPHIGDPLPKTWVKVRQVLEADPHNTITLTDYLNLCQENEFTKLEDKLQLSGYLHDLGVCLHFQDDPLLKKTIILKPTWGTAAVYKVLDNKRVINNLGLFTDADLASIWRADQYAEMHDELLRLMMNFKLCYEIPGRSGSYIAPQLLSANQPSYDWESSNNLLLRYEYEFMPKGILTRFIVEMHRWIDQQTCVWKTGVVLNQDQQNHTRAEVIENYRYHKGEIKIRVAGNRKKDLLTMVSFKLDEIHNSYERLKYSKLIPCNCNTCGNSQTPHFYRFEILRKFLDDQQYTIQCQTSYQMVDVRGLLDEVMEWSMEQVPEVGDYMHRYALFQLQSQTVTNLNKEVFISYAWGGDSEAIANQIDQAFQASDITLIRDKRDLGYKSPIKEFMERIGRGKVVIVVISQKYLQSENCMFELLQIAQNNQFYGRIFPIVLDDAKIYKPIDRIKYVKYWETQIQELDEAMREVSQSNLDGFRDDIDLYNEIRRHLPRLTHILKDMNTLTAKIHSESGFEELFEAVRRKLAE